MARPRTRPFPCESFKTIATLGLPEVHSTKWEISSERPFLNNPVAVSLVLAPIAKVVDAGAILRLSNGVATTVNVTDADFPPKLPVIDVSPVFTGTMRTSPLEVSTNATSPLLDVHCAKSVTSL